MSYAKMSNSGGQYEADLRERVRHLWRALFMVTAMEKNIGSWRIDLMDQVFQVPADTDGVEGAWVEDVGGMELEHKFAVDLDRRFIIEFWDGSSIFIIWGLDNTADVMCWSVGAMVQIWNKNDEKKKEYPAEGRITFSLN